VREQVYAILAKAYYNGRTDTVAHAPGGTLEGESNQHAVATVNFQTDDLMSLLDAQFDAGLAAAEAKIPADKHNDWCTSVVEAEHKCDCLEQSANKTKRKLRQQIRALRRGKAE
jgi:hypothetical protein